MFSLSKFINGFKIWNGEVAGKLAYYAILITIGGFILWSAFIKPTTKQVQELKGAFKGANIGIVNMNQQTPKKDKNWLAGVTILTDKDKDLIYGITISRQF